MYSSEIVFVTPEPEAHTLRLCFNVTKHVVALILYIFANYFD